MSCLLIAVDCVVVLFHLLVYAVHCVVSCIIYSSILLIALCPVDCVVLFDLLGSTLTVLYCLTYSCLLLTVFYPVYFTRVYC